MRPPNPMNRRFDRARSLGSIEASRSKFIDPREFWFSSVSQSLNRESRSMRPTAVALRRARRFADSLGDLASREKSGGKIARAVGTSPVFKFSSDGSSAGGCSLGAFHRARESATRGGERARGTRRDIARGTETSRAHTRTRGRRAETRCARARTSRASASNLFSIPATRKTRCDFYRPRARDSARRVAARARAMRRLRGESRAEGPASRICRFHRALPRVPKRSRAPSIPARIDRRGSPRNCADDRRKRAPRGARIPLSTRRATRPRANDAHSRRSRASRPRLARPHRGVRSSYPRARRRARGYGR